MMRKKLFVMSDETFSPLLAEYAKAKRDEDISAVTVLDIAAQYLERS